MPHSLRLSLGQSSAFGLNRPVDSIDGLHGCGVLSRFEPRDGFLANPGQLRQALLGERDGFSISNQVPSQ